MPFYLMPRRKINIARKRSGNRCGRTRVVGSAAGETGLRMPAFRLLSVENVCLMCSCPSYLYFEDEGLYGCRGEQQALGQQHCSGRRLIEALCLGAMHMLHQPKARRQGRTD